MKPTISDQQLVNYILRNLSQQQHAMLTEQIEHDETLQQRLTQWEHILFQLNEQTPPVEPPKAVWQRIEQRLFPDNVTAKKATKTRGIWAYLTPAFLVLALVFVGNFYLTQQPNYQAQIVAAKTQQAIWTVKGNHNSITFTSLKNIAMENMDCQAWIIKANSGKPQPLRLGAIPDTGRQLTKQIALPDNWSVSAGDEIIIVMTKRGYDKPLPPTGVPIMNRVILSAI